MTIARAGAAPPPPPSRSLGVGLWVVQSLLALTFVGTGVWKLVTPRPDLAALIPWAGEVSPGLLYGTAAFDLLGGLGVVLPSALRIRPGLAVPAALGCAALQACAIAFHLVRGEAANAPFNGLLLALALFVAWGLRKQTGEATRARVGSLPGRAPTP